MNEWCIMYWYFLSFFSSSLRSLINKLYQLRVDKNNPLLICTWFLKNQVGRTWLWVYFELKFFRLHTGSKYQVRTRPKIKFIKLDFSKPIFQKSSTDQQGVRMVGFCTNKTERWNAFFTLLLQKSIHFWNSVFWLFENNALQLMSASVYKCWNLKTSS